MEDGLDPTKVRMMAIGGVETRIWESGAGEPVVLVHGGDFGYLCSLDSWSVVLPRLARVCHVVAFDKLGQGHTGNPLADEDYSLTALMAHAVSVLKAIDLGPVHLVGHSMGAFLVTRIALDYPDLVATLTLVNSNTVAPDDPRYPMTRFYDELEARTPADLPPREAARLEPEAQSFSVEHVTNDFIDRMVAIALLPKSEQARVKMKVVSDAVWMPSLMPMRPQTIAEIQERGVPVPTLVVWGADDPSAPYPLAIDLFQRIRNRTEHAELHLLGRAGHYSFREQPHAFTRLLESFALGRPNGYGKSNSATPLSARSGQVGR